MASGGVTRLRPLMRAGTGPAALAAALSPGSDPRPKPDAGPQTGADDARWRANPAPAPLASGQADGEARKPGENAHDAGTVQQKREAN